MKTNILLRFIAIVSLFTPNLAAQNESLLNLVSNFPTLGAHQITLHVNAAIEVERWDENHLRVEIIVEKSKLSRTQLKSLASTGFYEVEAFGNAASLVLNMPGQLLPTRINGMEADKDFIFKIIAPHHATILRYDEPVDLIAGK